MVSSNDNLNKDLSNASEVGRSLSDDRGSIAGDRVNDGNGGWREYESGNGYTNSNDRWNDSGNGFGSNRDWARASSLYSAASSRATQQTAKATGLAGSNSGLAGSVLNGLLSESGLKQLEASNPDKYLETVIGAGANAYIDHENNAVRKADFNDWSDNYQKGAVNEYTNADRRIVGNIAGSIAAPAIGGMAAKAIGSGTGSMVAGMSASKASSSVGDISVGVQDYLAAKKLSEVQRLAQEAGADTVKKTYEDGKNGLVTGAGAVVDFLTGGASMGAGSAFASAFNHNSGMKNVANNLSHIKGITQMAVDREAAIAQSMKEDAERRKLDGSNTLFQRGILGDIAKNTTLPQSNNYTIPGIQNLWANVTIK